MNKDEKCVSCGRLISDISAFPIYSSKYGGFICTHCCYLKQNRNEITEEQFTKLSKSMVKYIKGD